MDRALSRWLKRQPFRAVVAFFAAIVLASGLITAVVMSSPSSSSPVPMQQTGTAAGRPHRASAAATLGHVVNGKVVHGTSGSAVSAAAKNEDTSKDWTKEVPGAVPPAKAPKPLHFPVRGKPHETLTVAAAPKPNSPHGYDATT